VVPIAPRYGFRLLEAIRILDDRTVTIAEVTRRVGRAAEHFGVTRPSYVHVRRLVLANRIREDENHARAEELRTIAVDVASDVLVGRLVDVYEVADRVREARER
jgi:hypothetical protein